MDAQRAREIAESPVMVNVTYNGEPVYIQHIDEHRAIARVYPLSQPEREQDVPVDKLTEHGSEGYVGMAHVEVRR